MKLIRIVLLGLGFFALWNQARAQQEISSTTSTDQPDTTSQAYLPAMNPNGPVPPLSWAFKGITVNNNPLDIASIADLQTLLEAVQTQPPVPLASLPQNGANHVSGNFWSLQHPYWPPLPGDIYGVDVWPLGNGSFIIDDRQISYAALQAAADAQAAQTAPASPMMRMSMMMSSLSTAYAYGNPVYLTNTTVSFANDGSITANFNIAGGTNFVPYDVLTATNLTIPVSSWNWLGIGFTSNNYTFYEQPASLGFYILAKPSKTMTVGIGNDVAGQCDVPYGLTNVLRVAGGGGQSLALKADGTVVAWGQDYYGQANVPTNLTGVAMVSAGWYHSVALLTNGTVVAWGIHDSPVFGNLPVTNVPPGLSNVIVISAQALHTLALLSNGTVVAWGYNSSFGETNVPAGLTNVTAISAGYQFNLVVSNGTVIAWGDNTEGQCNVPVGLTNVVDVEAGTFHSLALLQNGTVVAWGDNLHGETEVPAGLSNVVAIAAGGDPSIYVNRAYSMALQQNGTLVVWGDDDATAPFQGLTNVIGIAAGADNALAIRTGPRTPVITVEPENYYQVTNGAVTFTSRGSGLYGVAYQWQTNSMNLPGATNATLIVSNVQPTQLGPYAVVVTDNGGMGSITSSNVSIQLVSTPVITSESLPTNQTVPYQSNVTLSVTASAPGVYGGFPLSYQWQLNGTNISGATNISYTFYADVNSGGNYAVTVSNSAGTTTVVWQVAVTYIGTYIAPGTLSYYLSTNTTAYTNGIGSSSLYSSSFVVSDWTYEGYSGTNLAYLTNAVWSTNFWLKGVKGFSATSIGFSNGLGAQEQITMVSPRHFLFATHTHPEGAMIMFLDTNNVIYWRTAAQRVDIPPSFTYGISNDISVGILNADLPPSVGYLPVLPINFTNYLPTNTISYAQGVGMNQDNRYFGQPMTFGDNVFVHWNSASTSPFGLSTNWNVALRGGDSSNPEAFVIGSQLVLVSHNYTPLTGPNYGLAFAAINRYMHYISTNNAIGTDYQLTAFPMTNWPAIH